MARFIQDSDYDVLLRPEISKIIDNTEGKTKLLAAERMAIAQIRNHLAGRYDCNVIFTATPDGNEDTRDPFMVMLTIDIALYHLFSKEASAQPNKNRELRYNDALEWLKSIQKGETADLPKIVDTNGNDLPGIIIESQYPISQNRY